MNILFDIAVNIALITFGASADNTTMETVLIEDRDRNPTPIYVGENNNQTEDMTRFGVDVDENQLEKFSRFV